MHLPQSVARPALQRGPLALTLIGALAGALAAPRAALAQSGAAGAAADSVLVRAQRLVGAGQGAEGRQVIDSLLAVTPPDSPRYAEVLFTRASLSATAAQAERDYRRIFVEFPVSRRAPEALMRLAQLEMARGDRALARGHLERLTREHAGSPLVPRAHYWLARVRFEQGDVPRGCESLAAARAAAEPRDVELHNQVEFHAAKCPRPPAASEAAATAAPSRDAPSSDSRAAVPAPGAAQAGADARGGTPTGSVAPPTSSAVTDSAPSEAVRRPTSPPPESQRAPVTPRPATTPLPAAGAATGAATAGAPRAGGGFTVQVAAYPSRPPAEQLAAKLVGRGFAARVVGAAAPFRVRIGRYATWAEANAARTRLRGQQIDGFVVEGETR